MAIYVTVCLNSKGWLNVTHTLLRADYIGFSLFEVRLLACMVIESSCE